MCNTNAKIKRYDCGFHCSASQSGKTFSIFGHGYAARYRKIMFHISTPTVLWRWKIQKMVMLQYFHPNSKIVCFVLSFVQNDHINIIYDSKISLQHNNQYYIVISSIINTNKYKKYTHDQISFEQLSWCNKNAHGKSRLKSENRAICA